MRDGLGKILTVRDADAEGGAASGLWELLGVVKRRCVAKAA